MNEPRQRRSLTNVGGAIEREGDSKASEILAGALDVVPATAADAPDRAHVHGFHAYPARTHPVTARRLVEAFTEPAGDVLDPFCGSGTVLVEAMLAGRNATGTDLNPIAVMLSRAKTFPRSHEKTAALVASAREVAAFADARRKAKAGATRRLAKDDVAIFAPHVLLELDGIRGGIAKVAPEHRPELGLVLSSILVKLSAKRGDTSDEPVEKRVSAGYPARLFVKKTEELAARMDAFAALVPSPRPRVRVFQDDATSLSKVEDASVDAVITSPPYAATYDYLAHHALRMRWLGLDAEPLARGELGARRAYERRSPREARAAWKHELARLFEAFSRVTRDDAAVLLVVADSATARGPRGESPQALRADEIVAEVAREAGVLVPIARASQLRPHFHAPTAAAFADRPRAEHVLLLRRARRARAGVRNRSTAG
jgi:DNA modification methylase